MTPDPEYAMLELGAVVTTGSWTEVTDFARRRKDALRPEYKHQVSVVRLMPVVWS